MIVQAENAKLTTKPAAAVATSRKRDRPCPRRTRRRDGDRGASPIPSVPRVARTQSWTSLKAGLIPAPAVFKAIPLITQAKPKTNQTDGMA